MAYVGTTHPATGHELFRMLYGRSPKFPIDSTLSLEELELQKGTEEYLQGLKKKIEFLYDACTSSDRTASEEL